MLAVISVASYSFSYGDSLQVYLKNAGGAFVSNQYAKALELYLGALRFDSLNVDALKNVGVLYGMKPDYPKSLAYLRKAQEQAPNDAAIYNSLGITYLSVGDSVLALESYRKAVKLKGDKVDFLRNLSTLLVSLRKNSEAREYLTKILSLDSLDAESYYLMGNITAAENNYLDAEKNHDKAISLMPGNLRYLLNQAMTKSKLKKYEEAETIYRKIIAIQPTHFDARMRLGVLYIRSEKYPEALVQFEESAKIKPTSDEAQIFLGATYAYNNMPEKAQQVYDSLMVRNPDAAKKMINLVNPEEKQ